jgi:pilus assembly protein CpaC
VYVNNSRQINLYGKGFGETAVFATDADGHVIYSTNVLVSQNITSIDRMLQAAMPEADIKVTTVGQIAVLNGTVLSPADSVQAERLVTSLLNPGVDASASGAVLKIAVINRLKTATPLQVNLQVRFAEVSRSFVKNLGVNFQTADSTSGLKFGITQGRTPATQFTPNGPLGVGFTAAPANGSLVTSLTGSGTAALAGHLLGLDIISALDAGERDGQVSTLANPNLTALSGETGTFLAGGEIPIPVAQPGSNGSISIEYKEYGVSLAYTPTVLADGRISLRVRPEVSQLSADGAVQIQGTTIPALSTRRAETTIELGSGQSFMIAGLLQNNRNDQITKTPGVGDVPVLGALFRSNSWQRNETELVIVVTPYLVKPVNNVSDIALPTDGYKAPTDLGRIFMGELAGGTTGGKRPVPIMAPAATAAPSIGAVAPGPLAPTQAPAGSPDRSATDKVLPRDPKAAKAAAPGFDLN